MKSLWNRFIPLLLILIAGSVFLPSCNPEPSGETDTNTNVTLSDQDIYVFTGEDFFESISNTNSFPVTGSNQYSQPLDISVFNMGEKPLTVSNIYLSGSNTNYFMWVGKQITNTMVVSNNEEISVSLIFHPDRFGNIPVNIIIESDDPDDPLLTVPMNAECATLIEIWEKDPQTNESPYTDSVWDHYIELFESSNSGIRIRRIHKDVNTMSEEFGTAFSNGTAPELFCGPNDKIGPLQNADMLVSIDDFYSPLISNIDSEILKTAQIDQKVWGLPIALGNNLTLIYNKALLTNAPQSFDEITALTNRFTNQNDTNRIYPLVFNEADPFYFVPFYGAFGGKVFNEYGDIDLNNEAMESALIYLRTLKNNGTMPLTNVYTNGIRTTNTADGSNSILDRTTYVIAEQLFKEGRAATFINGSWSWQSYSSGSVSNLFYSNTQITNEYMTNGFEWGFATIPAVSGSGTPLPYYGSITVSVVSNLKGMPSDKSMAVKKFLEFLIDTPFQVAYATNTSQSPVTDSAKTHSAVTNDPFVNASIQQVANGLAMPIIDEMQDVWAAMPDTLEGTLYNPTNVYFFISNMQEEASGIEYTNSSSTN